MTTRTQTRIVLLRSILGRQGVVGEDDVVLDEKMLYRDLLPAGTSVDRLSAC